MKSSHAALAVIGLLLAGLWYAGGGSAPFRHRPRPRSRFASRNRWRTTTSRCTSSTVRMWSQNAKVVTLQEALDAGWAVVHETEDVNQLSVENRSSDHELFIQEGDIIKGGKQDRLIAIDMLLPPNSGRVSFPAHCVEQGRWTETRRRGRRQLRGLDEVRRRWRTQVRECHLPAGGGVEERDGAAGQTLRERRHARQRGGIREQLATGPGEPGGPGEGGRVRGGARERVARRKNVVGVVFVVNGKMTGAEVYGSNTLFQKAWPKLLNSAATEALAEKSAKLARDSADARRKSNASWPAAANRSRHREPGPRARLSATGHDCERVIRVIGVCVTAIPIEQQFGMTVGGVDQFGGAAMSRSVR